MISGLFTGHLLAVVNLRRIFAGWPPIGIRAAADVAA
jgi:hypothetical protein